LFLPRFPKCDTGITERITVRIRQKEAGCTIFKTILMKEYKIIKQTGTAVKSQQNFEDLINSYAKMDWRVVSMFTHRGLLKAVIERDKKEGEE
jgi:predicted SPOUT superfamily RNA methylase MTH1